MRLHYPPILPSFPPDRGHGDGRNTEDIAFAQPGLLDVLMIDKSTKLQIETWRVCRY